MLLKNAFNPEEETERDWDLELADDVKTECEDKYGKVLDIYVKKESTEVRASGSCVFLDGSRLTALVCAGRDLYPLRFFRDCCARTAGTERPLVRRETDPCSTHRRHPLRLKQVIISRTLSSCLLRCLLLSQLVFDSTSSCICLLAVTSLFHDLSR